MTDAPRLPFDPVERAGELWSEHFGEPTAMRVVTSIMRVQQLLLGTLDQTLRPWDLTFARYEVLVLLRFSRTGSLPLSKIGERLMVHPASVTNSIDRLEAQGYVRRSSDPADRRRVLASLTPEGKRVLAKATKALQAIDLAVAGLEPDQQDQLFDLLRLMRAEAGDFPG